MTSNAYQLWLKKREFKAPRLPLSPKASSSLTLIQLPGASKLLEDACDTSHDGVSAIETTLKSVDKPLASIKRPREEGSKHAKVAGRQDKVAGWKRQRSEQEVMKMMTPNWTKRVDVESTCSSVEETEEKEQTRSRNCSMQLQQMRERKVDAGVTLDGTTERLRFDADTKDGGIVGLDGVKGVGQLENSFNHGGKTLRTLVKSDDCTTTVRLRYCGGYAEEREKDVESSGLSPKSPMKPKQRNVAISMLDESQYWMAVDRFSHLA